MNSVTMRRFKLLKSLSCRCVKFRINSYQKDFQKYKPEHTAVFSGTLLSLNQKNSSMSVCAPGSDYIRLLENSDLDLCLTDDLPLEISGSDPVSL